MFRCFGNLTTEQEQHCINRALSGTRVGALFIRVVEADVLIPARLFVAPERGEQLDDTKASAQ
ncbi:hypothetical protein DPMN_106885 [Dreissena polymorpha]|uniref:Uncharacterized protein n=1 Tax=Dreissena polymorpha TaxID=45954 RepID=A0A9D4K5Z4_DREPO|nr:hypothetical protein DPMN_106885 [Dreissena polymorpha]